ncbi:MAG: four-carbon acid sugar kinase family protein [Candidatus Acidiferrales bacterium]
MRRNDLPEISIYAVQTKMAEEPDSISAQRACLALVVADDLTGACDAGVQFARSRLRSVVEIASGDASLDADVRIVNSRSRHELPEAAAEEVGRLTRCLAPDADTICLKKVDSTLRGNIVAESKAMMRAADLDFAVIAPALPAQGRTVAGGMLYVRDCAGSSTIDARAVLSKQGLKNIPLLSAGDATTPKKMAQEILRLRNGGAEFILCDSETKQDLERIAQALYQLPQRALWIGSAGLAKCAAQILATAFHQHGAGRAVASSEKSETISVGDSRQRPAPILFCIGSDHPVTMLQVRCLRESGKADVLNAGTATLDDVRNIVRQGRHLLLLLYGMEADCKRVRVLIAEARSAGISAALLSGGNTAEFVCDAIGAAAILLRDEVSPGIPWGVFRGGVLDGLLAVTKAGGFGDEMALVNVAELMGTIESGAQ